MRDWGAHILHSGRRVCCVLCRFRVVGPQLLLTAARLVYSGSFAGGGRGGREVQASPHPIHGFEDPAD